MGEDGRSTELPVSIALQGKQHCVTVSRHSYSACVHVCANCSLIKAAAGCHASELSFQSSGKCFHRLIEMCLSTHPLSSAVNNLRNKGGGQA